MTWKDGARWVYSITYDEGCAELLEHVLPLHRNYGIPGHVCLVASQVGVPRNVPGSSYHGMMILSGEEVRGLVAEGWGVSCHSMTHAPIREENAQYEVVESRRVLEDALDMPINVFCVPGDNTSFPASRAVAREAGYDAIMTIYDRINPPGCDLLSLGRVPIHTEYPPPFSSVFDPYKRLHQARDAGGWVIDYCHCPRPGTPIHPAKDCTTEELEDRFATVRRVGSDDVWLAEPGEVVAWIMKQRDGKKGTLR